MATTRDEISVSQSVSQSVCLPDCECVCLSVDSHSGAAVLVDDREHKSVTVL